MKPDFRPLLTGPYLPFVTSSKAAVQRSYCHRSCIAQQTAPLAGLNCGDSIEKIGRIPKDANLAGLRPADLSFWKHGSLRSLQCNQGSKTPGHIAKAEFFDRVGGMHGFHR
jgi:hypothetical protein